MYTYTHNKFTNENENNITISNNYIKFVILNKEIFIIICFQTYIVSVSRHIHVIISGFVSMHTFLLNIIIRAYKLKMNKLLKLITFLLSFNRKKLRSKNTY